MTFRGDERAVTVQVGAVLLFGIIVISMSMYQASVVPNQNEQVEFQHNQDVHDDFVSLRGTLIESAAESTTRPATVTLGTRYPSRALFVNPGPVTGTLETRTLGIVAISNVSTSEDETDDYVTDDALSFTTNSVEYRPSYNVLQNSPSTVYENTVAYNRFENGYNGTLTEQTLVDGRSISLVLVSGNYSENGVGTATFDARAVSPALRTVSVTNNSSDRNVTITVPTKLSTADWESILDESGELDGSGDDSNDAYVHDVRNGTGDSVVLVMERGETYNLQIGNVGVGSGGNTPSAHYLTVVDSSSSSVTFEVRDQYNNPVSGATLNATVLPATTLSAQGETGSALTGLRTDARGQIPVSLDSPTAGTYTVQASIDRNPATDPFDASRRQEANADVVVNSAGTGPGTGTSGPYDVTWDGGAMDAAGGSAVDYYSANDTVVVDSSSISQVDGVVDVVDSDSGDQVANVSVDFATNDSSVLTSGLDTDVTDGSGVATTTISVVDGVATAYATAGGSFDTLHVKVVSATGGGGGGGSGDAWQDTNENGVQDAGEAVDISDGQFDNSSVDLYVEQDASDVTADTINLNAKNIILEPNFTAQSSGNGDKIVITAADSVVIDGATLETSGSNADVSITAGGSISAIGTTVRTQNQGDISVDAGGNITASQSTLDASNKGEITLDAGGNIVIRNAVVSGDDGVTYTAGGTVDDSGTDYSGGQSP
ncbi:hypothetical protein GJR96_08590 [Haloferax sp. MBLA0076]|uniref:Big-1 domain-containing protein n=1 Tax=Haloferax litoreum TaxID=2666140 RepID=A0A6A8GHP8_9EURY|nr:MULTISPECIES: hypothetical protein [Haloferax]KAB1193497.1 hypothetical protein Hfx1148_08575 [Haloferax sp. CBA1148]MRX22012.1 hypothetical protein [Haloferax litoreum]